MMRGLLFEGFMSEEAFVHALSQTHKHTNIPVGHNLGCGN